MSNDMKILKEYVSVLPKEPVDVIGAIEALGIEYVETNLENCSGMIERLSEDSFRISVNGSDSKTRKRFTAAHELGHYLFHRDLFKKKHVDGNIYSSLERDNVVLVEGERHLRPKHEQQANQFAANFLIPPRVVNALRLKTPTISADELAKIFDVSVAAMKVRLGTYERKSA